jgi:hypothetical protein
MKSKLNRTRGSPVRDESWTSFQRRHGSKKKLHHTSPTRTSSKNTRRERDVLVASVTNLQELYTDRLASTEDDERLIAPPQRNLTYQQQQQRQRLRCISPLNMLDRIVGAFQPRTEIEKADANAITHENTKSNGFMSWPR